MPIIKSAKKKLRQSEKQRIINASEKSKIRTFLKNTRKSIESNEKEATRELLNKTASVLDKAAKRGIIHKNKSNRLKSKLAKSLNKIS